MLFGIAASTALLKDFSGVSTHRRTVRHGRFTVDLHVRVRDTLLETTSFSGSGYLHALGQELGSMPDSSFYELVDVVFEWMGRSIGPRNFIKGPYCVLSR